LINKGAQRVTKDTKGTNDHTVPQSYTEPYPTIPFPNHTLYSMEDNRPLVSARSAIMIVVHSAKVSTLYPRVVVISSPAERLENLLFAILYTSIGVWPRDHYMSLQRSTIRVWHALLRFYEQRVPACSAKVSRTNVPSCTMWFRPFRQYVTKYDHKVWCHPHSTEHDTKHIAYLISKQAVPYGHVVAYVVLGCLLLRFGPW
jgi:hypothetical protein